MELGRWRTNHLGPERTHFVNKNQMPSTGEHDKWTASSLLQPRNDINSAFILWHRCRYGGRGERKKRSSFLGSVEVDFCCASITHICNKTSYLIKLSFDFPGSVLSSGEEDLLL